MLRIGLIGLIGLLGVALPAAAQYPSERSLTILAGYPAGGLVDIVARVLAEGMKSKFPKGVVVVNRPGAAGSVAVVEVVRGRPDGYTVVLTPASALVIQAQLNNLAYKTPDDYEPVINLVSYYPNLVVRSEAPWKNAQELISEAKANPGKIRVGTPGEGTSSHLNLEELIFRAGIKVTHVPYAGWGQSAPALLGNHIEAVVAQPGEVKPQVDGKKLRLLMVFQPKRHALFPDVPTARELGWEVANGVWYLLAAPKGTPTPLLGYVHDAARAAVEDSAFASVMTARGVDVDYRPGEQLRGDLWKEYKLHTEILRRIGMLKR